ncbi:MAG: GTPase domain-containing protein [Phycisphaerae bacterium]
MQTTNHNIEDRLGRINRRLSELLGVDAVPLAVGGARALDDALWIWGIVGGKEVGKSTLINALAGAEVVGGGDRLVEGTFEPAAYFHEGDEEGLRARFGYAGGLAVRYHADAPESMRGLVLVDLPDFESLFTEHVERVRRVVEVLDGLIWLTTPKKVGDHRAIREIQRVLKARGNFVYVVNKMDWLLGQNDRSPAEALERMSAALRNQMAECDARGNSHRSFMISAKHRSAASILEAVSRSRAEKDVAELNDAGGALAAAAERVVGDFESLRQVLTTAPTAEATAANKRANLAYQGRRQARALIDHYRARDVLNRLDRNVSPEVIEELVAESFPQSYCVRLMRGLNYDRMLSAQWSSLLFRRRIGYWPLLGLIAWPLALVGSLVDGLRSLFPGSAAGGGDDPFRLDGLSLEDRVEGLLAGVGARLAYVSGQIEFGLPDAEVVTERFRGDVRSLADAQRAAVIEPYLGRRPSLIGRGLRWVVPLLVLAWFPIVQPLLAAVLEGASGGFGFNVETAAVLVQGLSGANVLLGLGVSILILGGLVAAVYSGAVRDSFRAMDRLGDGSAELVAGPLARALADGVARPIVDFRAELNSLTGALERLAKEN